MIQEAQCQHFACNLGPIARRVALTIGAISILFLSSCSDLGLNVELIRVGGVWITNVGYEPILINGIKINDRDNCNVWSLVKVTGSYEPLRPIELKVGEYQSYAIPPDCNIDIVVRVSVATNKGTATYSFQ